MDLTLRYQENCSAVEDHAMDIIASFHTPILNVLRDMTAHNCYTALCRLRSWYGFYRITERFTCLSFLTDYITCAYTSNSFYVTFNRSLTPKFASVLFTKLCREWTLILDIKWMEQIPQKHLEYILHSLQISVRRLPSSFSYETAFQDMLSLAEKLYERYLTQLTSSLASPPKTPTPPLQQQKSLPVIETVKVDTKHTNKTDAEWKESKNITLQQNITTDNANQKENVKFMKDNSSSTSPVKKRNKADITRYMVPVIKKAHLNETDDVMVLTNELTLTHPVVDLTGEQQNEKLVELEVENNNVIDCHPILQSVQNITANTTKRRNAFDILMKRLKKI